MAKLFGALLGLSSLIATWLVIASHWHAMSTSLKVYALVIPSIFLTIALAVVLIASRILFVRLYHRFKGSAPVNQYAFLEERKTAHGATMNKGHGWILILWLLVGTGLYAMLEKLLS
ncbi:hypothetical protein [Pseudomonas sp. NPDC096950]|uniref:hypothetical protein n=1 Tax=Pseudomonas sp. NPDC096950 TaxID=3364485 RepID=UPI003839F1CF